MRDGDRPSDRRSRSPERRDNGPSNGGGGAGGDRGRLVSLSGRCKTLDSRTFHPQSP